MALDSRVAYVWILLGCRRIRFLLKFYRICIDLGIPPTYLCTFFIFKVSVAQTLQSQQIDLGNSQNIMPHGL